MADTTDVTDKLSKSLDEIISERKKDKKFDNHSKKQKFTKKQDNDGNFGGNKRQNGKDRQFNNRNFNNNNNNTNNNNNNGGRKQFNTERHDRNNRNNDDDDTSFGNNRRQGFGSFKGGRDNGRQRGALVFVDNLHHDIVNSEIRELFEKIGALKRCGIKWDSLGRSTGSATVEFEQPDDARKAVNEYNGAVLDSQTLQVRLADDVRGPGIQKNIRKDSFSGRRVVSKYRD